MNPIVKWAGGKRSLLNLILEEVPKEYKNYLEPFLGGGAVLLGLKPKKALVNDLNSELMNMYVQVMENPQELMLLLDDHLANHNKIGDKEYYYKIRDQDRLDNFNDLDDLYKASRFIYLNKAGYNGLYRVNMSGYFNVPLGRRKKLNLYDRDNVFAVHKFLNEHNIEIFNMDYYTFVKENVRKGDFVYLDPPYDIPENGELFTNYQQNGFGREEQDRLYDLCEYLDKRGAYFLQSNSDTKYIREKYKKFKDGIIEVQTRRLIGSKSSSRGSITELMIKNY